MKHSRNPQGKRWSCHTNIPTSSPSGNRQGIHDISVHLRSRIVTYLVVPWLRLHAPNARGLGAIPDEGIRSRVTAKSLHTTTKRRKGWRVTISCAPQWGPAAAKQRNLKNRSSNKIKLYILTSITVTLKNKATGWNRGKRLFIHPWSWQHHSQQQNKGVTCVSING